MPLLAGHVVAVVVRHMDPLEDSRVPARGPVSVCAWVADDLAESCNC
jgi:hypothetical protein